jgi:hypothetical protein
MEHTNHGADSHHTGSNPAHRHEIEDRSRTGKSVCWEARRTGELLFQKRCFVENEATRAGHRFEYVLGAPIAYRDAGWGGAACYADDGSLEVVSETAGCMRSLPREVDIETPVTKAMSHGGHEHHCGSQHTQRG